MEHVSRVLKAVFIRNERIVRERVVKEDAEFRSAPNNPVILAVIGLFALICLLLFGGG